MDPLGPPNAKAVNNEATVVSELQWPPLNDHSDNSANSSGEVDFTRRGTWYAPIRSEAAPEMWQLKRNFSQLYEHLSGDERTELRAMAASQQAQSTASQRVERERKDTLAGVSDDDPRLDPESPTFDIYIWARAFMRSMDENQIQIAKSGFTFKNLSVSGSGSALSLQATVGSVLLAPFRLGEYFNIGPKPQKQILRNFNGVVKSGEMLVVLGRPGSGCSTFLKTICGELTGLQFEGNSTIHYNGISQTQMINEFRGEVVYNQEVDKHFAHLTVGETLEFAAAARTSHRRPKGISRSAFIKHMTRVVMTILSVANTGNTLVGDDFVRGVSGGERKRVSIAEMMLAGSPIACWDNSTRGLDSATALDFTRALRIASNLEGMVNAVAIYQASQAIYDMFDKAIVLYEGRQIYFGAASEAKAYFEDMGWYCPSRQTTGDFLTSVTNPIERKARTGFESKVPRTPDEFEAFWQSSQACAKGLREIRDHDVEVCDTTLQVWKDRHYEMQAKHLGPNSPYVISVPMMIALCSKRAYYRIMNDKTSTVTTVVGQILMAIVVGTVYYGHPNTSSGFFDKGAICFFAIVLNGLIALSEVNKLFYQRAIVDKQASYAFYHPWTEAFAGVVTDIPLKFFIAVVFNSILYFLSGLRPEPGPFFLFFLFTFLATLTMSAIFRSIAALTKTVSQAMAFAGVVVIAIAIYTGFTLPRPYEHPWLSWVSWINPIAYAFEAILVNEVHNRRFPCDKFVPAIRFQKGESFICGTAGAVAGELDVSGDAWIETTYEYTYSNIWRNLGMYFESTNSNLWSLLTMLGILFAFDVFFLCVYLVATEYNSSRSSSAERLVFRRGHVPNNLCHGQSKIDEEVGSEKACSAGSSGNEKLGKIDDINAIQPQKGIFTWRNVVHDMSIKGESRRILDHVSGWVKPGTLTALMGVSGAGKTTLLDVLAQRRSLHP